MRHRNVVIGTMLLAGFFQDGVAVPAAQTTSAPPQAMGQLDSKPLRVYGPEDHDVIIPKVIYAPDPEFSKKARSKKLLSGSCVFSVLVDAQGNPQDVQMVKSLGEGLSPKQAVGCGSECDSSGAGISL